jgi:hypothetical protein
MRYPSSGLPGPGAEVEILLDGIPVEMPANLCSPNGIRHWLETLALEQQRVLCALIVDGRSADLLEPLNFPKSFSRVEAETVGLDETAVLVLKTAACQVEQARASVEKGLTLVLINGSAVSRELWWELARQLKEPVLTLSLLPENGGVPLYGSVSLTQLRKWQLEQIAVIIRDVDEASELGNTIHLSNALENRVLPWLEKLYELVLLWHETVLAASRLGIKQEPHF